MPESFSWLMFIPAIGHDHELLAIAHSWMVVAFLIVLALMVNGRIKKAKDNLTREDLVPDDHLNLRSAWEFYVESILGMMRGQMGDNARPYFWLVGTLFIYIFCSNLMGLLPGLLPPTENVNNNFALAMIVFFAYHLVGIKYQGFGGYFKHWLGPVLWLGPLMFIIEAISYILVRPGSLTIRLFGNINGDHLVLGIFSQVLPEQFSRLMGLGIPVIFLGLGLIVSFMQAFVFSLLTSIYLGGSMAHGHDDHGHDHNHDHDHAHGH
jgi:F-type H+-transporting ATPase subunit a